MRQLIPQARGRLLSSGRFEPARSGSDRLDAEHATRRPGRNLATGRKPPRETAGRSVFTKRARRRNPAAEGQDPGRRGNYLTPPVIPTEGRACLAGFPPPRRLCMEMAGTTRPRPFVSRPTLQCAYARPPRAGRREEPTGASPANPLEARRRPGSTIASAISERRVRDAATPWPHPGDRREKLGIPARCPVSRGNGKAWFNLLGGL